jgi:hypothetical protein
LCIQDDEKHTKNSEVQIFTARFLTALHIMCNNVSTDSAEVGYTYENKAIHANKGASTWRLVLTKVLIYLLTIHKVMNIMYGHIRCVHTSG